MLQNMICKKEIDMKKKDRIMRRAIIKTFKNVDEKVFQDEEWKKIMLDFVRDTKERFAIPESIIIKK